MKIWGKIEKKIGKKKRGKRRNWNNGCGAMKKKESKLRKKVP